MGQKVNPISYRLQVSKDWSSKWFTLKKSDFRKNLVEDAKIRETVENRFKARPTIAKVNIERSANLTTVIIFTAKAGAVIGKQGAGINELKKELEKIVDTPIRINVEEIKKRLNGAEMSRREKFIEGSVPLHTLRADIDFYCCHAPTIAGIVGVKVWIYKGEK